MCKFFKKKKKIEDYTKIEEKIFDQMVDNNLKGIELEKKGNIDEAIKLYEFNIKHDFDGNHPYDRLAIIYRKQEDYNNEIRVLNHAVNVFTRLQKSTKRRDVKPKLEKFKTRLEKAKLLKEKQFS